MEDGALKNGLISIGYMYTWIVTAKNNTQTRTDSEL